MTRVVSNNRVCSEQQGLFGKKVSSFIVNYNRELRMGTDIRRKGKVEKTTEFIERMKRVQEEARVALRKVQEDMKQQANRR